MADDRDQAYRCRDCGCDIDLITVDLGDTWAHDYTWMCAKCITSWDETGKPRWCAGEMANRIPV